MHILIIMFILFASCTARGYILAPDWTMRRSWRHQTGLFWCRLLRPSWTKVTAHLIRHPEVSYGSAHASVFGGAFWAATAATTVVCARAQCCRPAREIRFTNQLGISYLFLCLSYFSALASEYCRNPDALQHALTYQFLLTTIAVPRNSK